MPNRTHFLYENLIFKVVRIWEHGHFVDILGKGHLKHGKVYFAQLVIFLSLFSLVYIYKINKERELIFIKFKEEEEEKEIEEEKVEEMNIKDLLKLKRKEEEEEEKRRTQFFHG